MKKPLPNFSLLSALILYGSSALAQWCVPNTIIPYATTMPGITHVVVGTIDRTSADLEHYPSNSYVLTGLSTDLAIGNTYTISITHTIDASICPDMNLRVWIDYNLDYSFDDIGETVITANHHAAGTYTGTFTVPATAAPGTTRMRIVAKMSDLGGHTAPTPCDFPNPDPLGYHGEMEDYTVNILNTTGIPSTNQSSPALSVFPSVFSDHTTLSIQTNRNTNVCLYNLLGETVCNWNVPASVHRQEIEINTSLLNMKPGMYFVRAASGNFVEEKKIIVLK
jgi:hypothetical protein